MAKKTKPREARVGSSANSSVAPAIYSPSTLYQRTEREEVLGTTLQLGKGSPKMPEDRDAGTGGAEAEGVEVVLALPTGDSRVPTSLPALLRRALPSVG